MPSCLTGIVAAFSNRRLLHDNYDYLSSFRMAIGPNNRLLCILYTFTRRNTSEFSVRLHSMRIMQPLMGRGCETNAFADSASCFSIRTRYFVNNPPSSRQATFRAAVAIPERRPFRFHGTYGMAGDGWGVSGRESQARIRSHEVFYPFESIVCQ